MQLNSLLSTHTLASQFLTGFSLNSRHSSPIRFFQTCSFNTVKGEWPNDMKTMTKKKIKLSVKYLPLEIWTLILERMPSKTLLQFRSVCKPWRSVIDDSDFVYLHFQLNRNTKNQLLIAFEVVFESNCRKMTIRRADNFKKTGHNLTCSKTYCPLRSCTGLLFMWQVVDKKNELRLCNPGIRKSLRIPPCPIPSHLQNRTAVVFGFAPSTKEHKILVITFDETPGTQPKDMFSAVYTLSDQQWTVRNSGLDVERSCYQRIFWSFNHQENTVFLDGAVHTIVNGLYRNDEHHLLFLDFNLEKATFLKLLNTSDKAYTYRKVFILEESVAVFSISQVNASIWVPEIDGEKRMWTLRFSEPSTRDGYDLFDEHRYSKALDYESDYAGCLIIGMYSYNIATGEVQKRGKSMRKRVELETYSESLMLHKGCDAIPDDVLPLN